MHRPTVQVYEDESGRWLSRRRPRLAPQARAFGRTIAAGGVRADLGCGPGWYSAQLGVPTVAMDAARAMLDLTASHAPGAWRVQGDLEALPFRSGVLAGAWASASYVHVESVRLPLALADLHRSLRADARIRLILFEGDGDGAAPSDDFPGRRFAYWQPARLRDVVAGAGFIDVVVRRRVREQLVVSAERGRTLPDVVGPRMRLLVCGLNPSLYAADAGIPFARPGNRFWPAALAAGIVPVRDPRRALLESGIGFTDIVKRATTAASQVERDEFVEGIARVERLCAWLRPRVVCVVGLSGWRAAVDPVAVAGPQPQRLGGCAVYVMPSSSGRNAHARTDELAAHLERAISLRPASRGRTRRRASAR